jgi:hypothetical protein
MKDQGKTKQIIEVISDKTWLSQHNSLVVKFSMNIVKPANIHVSFHYKFSSSLDRVYKEKKVISLIGCAIKIGGILYEMKWLRQDISHSIDVVRDMENSGGEVKCVLQSFRGTSVTYNGFNCLIYDNCNLDFAGIFDRMRSTLTYVSKHCLGRHVGGGVISEKIHILTNCTNVFLKPVLLEKLQFVLGFSWLAT